MLHSVAISPGCGVITHISLFLFHQLSSDARQVIPSASMTIFIEGDEGFPLPVELIIS